MASINSLADELTQIFTDKYTVQKGDTLLKVAMKFETNRTDLAFVNRIQDDKIFPNQVSLIGANTLRFSKSPIRKISS